MRLPPATRTTRSRNDDHMRIAIVGSGISGLGAAYALSRVHDVQVFEREARAGGHANTVVHDGLGLDTGFLVHNLRNYPLLTRLFAELGVATHESDMAARPTIAAARSLTAQLEQAVTG